VVKGTLKTSAAAVSVLLVAAACSSSKHSQPPAGESAPAVASASTTSSAPQPGKGAYTVGLLTDLTGLGASSSRTSVQGVEAGVAALAAQSGYTIKFVTADTTSAPAGALTAAQKLVEQDHVFAIIAASGLLFAASNYLTTQGIPVVGVAVDGPEWITAKNMFSVFGPLDFTKVTTTQGGFFKMRGATVLGTLGYSISPSSSEAAEGAAVSAENAGLKVGYVNSKFAFGGTDVQPVALAMKAAHVDAISPSVDPNTSFALITALRQAGVDLKVALLPTGYGGDLAQAGPGALQAAQDVYFLSSWEPVEMDTPATKQFRAALKSIGVTTDPTYGEYAGYTSVALLVQGLEAAGVNPTRPALINALSGITDFNAAGLYGSHTLDMGDRSTAAVGVDNCYWITKLSGSTFQLVRGADPVCGTVIPGKTVSPSS
jgi:ABC-type branched-subunit amino acid transport system substrate-binding protein